MGDIPTFDINALLASMGSSPFDAMAYLFLNGGWVLFVIACIWMFIYGWLEYKQTKYLQSKEGVCLAIDIPKSSEKDPGQALRGVENIFGHLAGAHSTVSWTDKWFRGVLQDEISLEIISIEGHVQFMVYTVRRFRDLVEASIYSQYPEAEIVEVEDYSKNAPSHYPDREYDLWATEMTPVKSDLYPIRTYPLFEHSMTSELKDPIAVLLEALSRLGVGEQAWLQFIIVPIEQKKYREKAEALIKKLKGEKTVAKTSVLEQVLFAPFNLFIAIANVAMGSETDTKKPEKDMFQAKIFNLTPGERKALEAVENKASKIAYLCKIRFVYVGKKTVFQKPRIVNSFIGFMKQMNTNDMLALKPDLKKVGLTGSRWFFKDKRNNLHKNRLIKHYRRRSAFDGLAPYYLCTEELATYWHFPHTFQVRAPQLKKREVKSVEPPYNLPIV